MVHVGQTSRPKGMQAGMGYSWTDAHATNSGNPTTGVVGTVLTALTVGAPSAGAKLQRTELRFLLTLAGTATGVAITPDWPLKQVCMAVAVAQFAGDTALADPYGVRDPNTVLVAPVDFVGANQSFASSQGSVVLSTAGLLTSQAQRNTPPSGGWQVRLGFRWDDDAGFVSGFGSNFRWHWRADMACLWRT